MRIVVLTSSAQGTASNVIPALVKNPEIDLAMVIYAQGLTPDKKRLFKKKLAKVLRIGVLGAINGFRMRGWYADKSTRDLEELCQKNGIQLERTPFINCETTRNLFNAANAELGLSLGNGYIPESVFSIPKFGMINIHSEILPDFQGAQSVIWPIYEGVTNTGITIHQIDKGIDTGAILYQQVVPIEFYPRLSQTVKATIAKTSKITPDAFSHVCSNYVALREKAEPQGGGKSYTTPSIWQFLRMVKNNHRFYKKR